MENVYEQAKANQAALELAVAETSKTLKAFPRLTNGLTPDAVKATPEYQTAKAQSVAAVNALRRFNQKFLRIFEHQIKQERKSR